VDLDTALQFGGGANSGEGSAFVESGNKVVGDEFIHAFRVVPECNGITFITDNAKPVDFTVSVHVSGRLQHPAAQSWIYVVTDLKTRGRDFMQKYREAKFDAQTTAKDVCMKVWDRVDPNRIPGAGGKVR